MRENQAQTEQYMYALRLCLRQIPVRLTARSVGLIVTCGDPDLRHKCINNVRFVLIRSAILGYAAVSGSPLRSCDSFSCPWCFDHRI
jgi:hypothetical protein